MSLAAVLCLSTTTCFLNPSEKMRPDGHHLLPGVQPMPVHIRLWLLLPFRGPLLLPGRGATRTAARPPPGGRHPPAFLTRWNPPLHGRPEGALSKHVMDQLSKWQMSFSSIRVLVIAEDHTCVGICLIRTQKFSAGTCEIQDRFCSACAGGSPRTSASTSTWTREC